MWVPGGPLQLGQELCEVQVRGCQGERQYHLACTWIRHWVRLLIEVISFGSHNKPRKCIWLSSIYWIGTEKVRNLPNCSKIINARAKTWSEYIWSQSFSPPSALLLHFLTYTRADVHLGRQWSLWKGRLKSFTGDPWWPGWGTCYIMGNVLVASQSITQDKLFENRDGLSCVSFAPFS